MGVQFEQVGDKVRASGVQSKREDFYRILL